MDNLKTETLTVLTAHGKSVKDIRWIGREDGAFKIEIDLFFKLADKEYDSGYGGQEVNPGLVVVGDDWWLERHEYDGSEWWEFKTCPMLSPAHKFSKTIFEHNFDHEWEEMSNLEYLEFKDEQQMGTNPK